MYDSCKTRYALAASDMHRESVLKVNEYIRTILTSLWLIPAIGAYLVIYSNGLYIEPLDSHQSMGLYESEWTGSIFTFLHKAINLMDYG